MRFGEYPAYVPVAERRAQGAREIAKLQKQRAVAPVVIEGRKIAQSFWGIAWCDNLERQSRFASRLPRGRAYVRNGSVIDLQIERGTLRALVCGSEIYQVTIDIAVAKPSRWKAICADCTGSVGSLVELLQGKLSNHVMERVCRDKDGLFPAPSEIRLSCSCPDYADMCKHVAAVLYGVGARLDAAPELLFTLRGVDRSELVAGAGADGRIPGSGAASEWLLVDVDIAALFGLDMAPGAAPEASAPPPARSASARGRAKDATAVTPAKRAGRKSAVAGGQASKPTAAVAKNAAAAMSSRAKASNGKASKPALKTVPRAAADKRSVRTKAAKR
jgi:SWIM zinc finger